MRYVIETECEHGEVAEHSTHTPQDAQAAFDAGDPDAVYTNPKFTCPGGSRRVVEPTATVDWCSFHKAQATELGFCWVGATPFSEAHKDCVIVSGLVVIEGEPDA